jgi:hypothetical protein
MPSELDWEALLDATPAWGFDVKKNPRDASASQELRDKVADAMDGCVDRIDQGVMNAVLLALSRKNMTRGQCEDLIAAMKELCG